ncbi:uncharacterized protein BJX67DRAFT_300098 [Aspergillus lucknowensis]|uniref:Uncharacterized protein n=1 Tax=Aspergillus lucknowensis TaxID=176173 RepID=A0ABR4M2M0_9EURO
MDFGCGEVSRRMLALQTQAPSGCAYYLLIPHTGLPPRIQYASLRPHRRVGGFAKSTSPLALAFPRNRLPNENGTAYYQLTQLRCCWPMPMRSSRDRTILALSPGKGFNSSLGSRFTRGPLCDGLFSRSSLRSRSSSNIVRSSDVIAIAVGLRRIIARFGQRSDW